MCANSADGFTGFGVNGWMSGGERAIEMLSVGYTCGLSFRFNEFDKRVE
jgi:hypothetical protein